MNFKVFIVRQFRTEFIKRVIINTDVQVYFTVIKPRIHLIKEKKVLKVKLISCNKLNKFLFQSQFPKYFNIPLIGKNGPLKDKENMK